METEVYMGTNWTRWVSKRVGGSSMRSCIEEPPAHWLEHDYSLAIPELPYPF
jgi:hypothetical protein